jgi:hypothetical protein
MLCLLASVLTVAASGDDFNVLRLALSPSPLGSAPLPLDDPNTDFVRSTDPQHLAQFREHACEGTALVSAWPGASPFTSFTLLLAVTAAGTPDIPHVELNLPLLC